MEVCDRVMNGEYVYPEDVPVIRIGYSNSAEFTSREFDIIRELAQGRKYEEIAADLGITPNTVKYHIKNILQKTGYQNTLQQLSQLSPSNFKVHLYHELSPVLMQIAAAQKL